MTKLAESFHLPVSSADWIALMQTFARIVEAGSLSAAAAPLGDYAALQHG